MEKVCFLSIIAFIGLCFFNIFHTDEKKSVSQKNSGPQIRMYVRFSFKTPLYEHFVETNIAVVLAQKMYECQKLIGRLQLTVRFAIVDLDLSIRYMF